jgi:hypothetical protein
MHLMQDSLAAIEVRRTSPYDDTVEVNSLHFTTLNPHATTVLINVEMDDEGFLSEAKCNCLYSRLGLKTIVSNVNSFGKVSPMGMTFHASELQHILDELLPQRFGGGPGDYQIVECEAPNAQTRLVLYVSPRVGLKETELAGRLFLEWMRPRWGGALATRAWDHAGGIKVVIAPPFRTDRGKVHPVRLLASTSKSISVDTQEAR